MIQLLTSYAHEHPWLFFILACFAIYASSEVVIHLFFNLPNRFIRAGIIKARGWPPPYLDGDGDPVKPPKTLEKKPVKV